MISFSKISSAAGAAKYHDKAFNQDGSLAQADNYYVNEKAVAVWQGKGAELLGINGKEVEKDQFVAFLSGKMPNPETGQIQNLNDASNGKDRRLGFDLTVAPSKSVSVVALVAGDTRVTDAHANANKAAMQWLEANGAMVRTSKDGVVKTENKGNLLYASVTHVTNRDNEPHLHTHNVVVATVYDQDAGKWRSLTNDEIMRLRTKADAVYKSTLAHELKNLGYGIEYAKNGVDFEIKGFTKEQVNAFSSRSNEIAQALGSVGLDKSDASYGARQTATLDSRKAKNELDRGTLTNLWASISDRVGLNHDAIVSEAKGRAVETKAQRSNVVQDKLDTIGEAVPSAIKSLLHSKNIDPSQKSALLAVSWAVKHHAERDQAFRSTDLEFTALRFLKSAGTISDVQWAIGAHKENRLLIDRGSDVNGAQYLTTARAIKSEEDLFAAIQQGKNQGNTILGNREEFNTAIRDFNEMKSRETGSEFKLSKEQIRAAHNVLMHPDGIQGIQGEAGTGKTAALAMVRTVAESKGWVVQGMATSASAAVELESASGIKSMTIAGFFAERERAIQVAKAEIDGLKSKIIDMAGGKSQPLESRVLNVSGEFTSFGKARYVFDHAQGEVYKSRLTISNAIGTYLLDFAGKARSGATISNGESFLSQLKSGALAAGANFSEKIGRSITTLDQVGTVEAISARRSLYLDRESPIGDMKETLQRKEAELANLQKNGRADGKRVLMVMDEASLTGAEDMTRFLKQAKEINARVVLQGDTKQHSSVPAGLAFAQAQAVGMNVSVLKETRRFDRAAKDAKQAVRLMQGGEYQKGIATLRNTTVEEGKFVAKTAERYISNLEVLKGKGITDPLVSVVTMTNRDRKAINEAISAGLASRGHIGTESFSRVHLDYPKITDAQRNIAGELQAALVDSIVIKKTDKTIGVARNEVLSVKSYDLVKNLVHAVNQDGRAVRFNPQVFGAFAPAIQERRDFRQGDKVEARDVLYIQKDGKEKNGHAEKERIANKTKGVIESIDKDSAVIKWANGSVTKVGGLDMMHIDHSYAHTTFIEQGATTHREIIAVSKIGGQIFNREAAYVSATRAKGITEIVASEAGWENMLKNAGRQVDKTTAVDWEHRLGKQLPLGDGLSPDKNVSKTTNLNHQGQQIGKNQELVR